MQKPTVTLTTVVTADPIKPWAIATYCRTTNAVVRRLQKVPALPADLRGQILSAAASIPVLVVEETEQ